LPSFRDRDAHGGDATGTVIGSVGGDEASSAVREGLAGCRISAALTPINLL
jgi:hypothetical protein